MSDHKIDILIMSDNSHNTVGGEQESTKIILEGLNQSEFSTAVIHPGIPPENTLEKVRYLFMTNETRIKHLVKRPMNFIKYILKARYLIRLYRPKVIHTQAQVSFFIVALLRKTHLIPKDFTFIHTERGLYLKYNSIFRRLFIFFMNQLDILVTTTEYNMKSWKSAIKGKKPKKFFIIPNTAGKEFEEFNEKLKKKNVDSDKFVIGFAGRYCDWKNWPLAVEIIDKMNNQIGQKLEVRMAVGCLDEASLEDTHKMFDHLYKKLNDRFKGDINISITEMNRFYYDIDAFILTSDKNTESFGRTLVEAMSRRNVVFTTPAGGSEEVVPSPENVFYTTDEIVKKLLVLAGEESFLIKEQNAGLNYVKNKYSLENNINLHQLLYKGIVGVDEK